MTVRVDSFRSDRAFTLIEVLAAMLLVTVLMLAIFPGLRTAHAYSQRHTAASEALEIATAALAYRQVYGTWPCESDDNAGGTEHDVMLSAGDTELAREGLRAGYNRDIGKIIEVLRCGDIPDIEKHNPRSIVFLELPTSCFHRKGGTNSAYPYDPWGHPYVMLMARERNNTVSRLEGGISEAIPDNTYGVSGVIESPDDVVVFSWGDPTSPTNGLPRIIGSWSTR